MAKPEDFARKSEEMIAKYKVREEGAENSAALPLALASFWLVRALLSA